MTLTKDRVGRKVLEGTVYVAIAFSPDGDILGCWANRDKKNITFMTDKFVEVQGLLGFSAPIIGHTIATYRDREYL